MSVNSEMTALADQVRRMSGETAQLGISAMTAALTKVTSGGGGGVDLADVDVYVADFYSDEVAVTAGALDVYKRIIIS